MAWRRIGLLGGICLAAVLCAPTAWAQFPSELVGFNGPPIDDESTSQEMFRLPQISGTTSGYILPNGTGIFDNNAAYRASGLQTEGAAAMQVYFKWRDPADPNLWLRLTTFEGPGYPNPALHTGGKVRFKFTNRSELFAGRVGVCIGVRETGIEVSQLANGGVTGPIEWVGASGAVANPDGTPRPVPIVWLDPSPVAYSLEFDLATGQVKVDGVAQGSGIAAFSGDGVIDITPPRGTLEHIAFVNDPADGAQLIDVAIDELQFEAPVPDPTPRPSVVQPVFSSATSVQVQCITAATQAELFRNGNSLGTKTPIGGVATFSPVNLVAGDVLTATQTANGLLSPPSLPVIVLAPGVLLADNFDSYETQADLNVFWFDSVAAPTPSNAKLLLQPGGAASCPNFLLESNPAGANAARLYRGLSGANGTDASPLRCTWYFKNSGTQGGAGPRTRFELAHFNGAAFSAGARADGTAGITLFNQVAGALLSEFNLTLRVTDDPNLPNDLYSQLVANGWVDSGGFLRYPSGVAKTPGVWHKMQIEVKSTTINFYIDDVNRNPAPYQAGIPRPNETAYDFIIIGEGFSSNGPTFMFDNVAVTQGAAYPFGAPVPPAPALVGPLFPGATSASLAEVDPAATKVTVYADGALAGSANGPFADGTAMVPVNPAFANTESVTATQTIGGTDSCGSIPVTVGVPAVAIADDVLVPTQTSVTVSGVAAGVASLVTVFSNDTTIIGTLANPASDTVVVPTSGLVLNANITATQTIAAVQGPPSAAKEVTLPAPVLPGPATIGDTSVMVQNVHPLAGAVTVYVNNSVGGTVNPAGQTTVSVPLTTSIFIDDEIVATQTIGGTESADSNTIRVEIPLCLIVFADDFETNTSSLYSVRLFDAGGAGDALATFNYNYALDGIPPSPNGGGATRALKLECNRVAPGQPAAITASPTGLSFSATAGYRLSFDMWLNANGPFPAGGTGSTQSITCGVGADDTTVLEGPLASSIGATANSGKGAWFQITGEGGSTDDVRAFKDRERQFPASGQYAAGTADATDDDNNAAYYKALFGNPGPTPPAAQTALFPAQNGNTNPGSAGFAWHHVTVTVYGTKARWDIDDTPIVTIDTTIGNPFSGLNGNVAFGAEDSFASVTDNPAMLFALVDNVQVLVALQLGSNGDFDGNGSVNIDDADALTDCFAGPALTPAPAAGGGCVGACRAAFDMDEDGDIDLTDVADFQVLFNP